MTHTDSRLRVVAATPISEELIELVMQREPRVDFVRDQALLPPMRHPGDHAGDPEFTRTAEQQARFDELVDSADALYGLPSERPDELRRTADANPNLRWVQTMAAGGGAQVRAAKLSDEQLGRVAFTSSAGVHGEPLAEFSVFGLLAGAKLLPRLLERQSRREWAPRFTMSLISEQRILVIGLGGIGKVTAQKLSALGATVIGTSRREVTVPGVDEIVHPDDLVDVVGSVDGVVVTLPGTAATERLLGERFFAAVKPGTTLVNVGRGTVIDEPALIRALDHGRIGFAALDVVASEPLDAASPLWTHPGVLISPHTAALNPAEDRLIAELFARNATRLLDGEPLINRVDTVEFY